MRASLVFAIGAALLLLSGCGDKDVAPKDSSTIDTPTAGDAPAIDGPTVDGPPGSCACVMMKCSQQLTACQTDSVCTCTYNCVIGGSAEGTCKQLCKTGNNMAWSDMITCIDAMCPAGC
jgi:hypothetical protein